jgi:iron complex outermembrane recepter protein
MVPRSAIAAFIKDTGGWIHMRRMKRKTWGRMASIGMALGMALYASGPAAGDEVLKLQKFQVTGSNIKRTDYEGPSPLVVLDRAKIERSGAATTAELFRDVIYDTAGMMDESFTQGFAPASAGIDLRGMGVNRTLVLVNGRRMPLFPFGQDGTSSFVDINLIPLGAIERVEILKDGASAIYGADAVAGVVNIITRSSYQGVEVSADHGQTGHGDGEQTHLSLTGGTSGEKGKLAVTLDYLDRGAIWARDRDISASANGPIDNRSTLGNPGTLINLKTGNIRPDPRCPPGNVNRGFCSYDFAPYVTLMPGVRRLGMAVSGEYPLTEDINLFADALLSHSDSARDLAPAGGAFFIAPSNPNTNSPNNPFPGQPEISIYRLLELGPRRDEFKTDAYNLTLGLKGYTDSWDWEISSGFGRIDSTIRGVNGYALADEVQTAIDNGTLNPFGASPNFDPAAVTYTTRRKGASELWLLDAKASSEILEMTYSPLALAVGAEYRNETFSDQMDPASSSGDVLGVGSWNGEGSRDVIASYAELSIPLFKTLEMQLAGRFDHYSDFGDTFNPKLGLRWKPRDNLLLRLSAGTGFKAPSLQELHAGTSAAPVTEQVFDPMTGRVVEVDSFKRGNPDLKAEESKSLNLGLVWDVTQNWNIGVDFWHLQNKHAVTNSPQFYVSNEALYPGNVTRDANGNIVSVTSPFQNVAAQKLWGIDLDTGAHWTTASAGSFRFDLAAAYLGSFKQEPVTGAGFQELAGIGADQARPRWRGRASLGWSKASYDAGFTVHYTGGYDRPDASYRVSDWTTVDAQLGWAPKALPGGKVTLGINNLFDRTVPEDPYLEGWPFYNRALYDARGRFFYLSYKQKF